MKNIDSKENAESLTIKRERFIEAFATIGEIIFDSLCKTNEKNTEIIKLINDNFKNDGKLEKNKEMAKLLSAKDLAEYFKIPISSVYNMVHKKKIDYVKLGSKLMFRKIDIKNYVDANSFNLD